jgi:hypothetical protein
LIATLAALKRFDESYRNDLASLANVGLILDQSFVQSAWCENTTPQASVIFAVTGGDSVHFCLLEIAGRPSEESPVVMVVPCNPDTPRLVVGDNLQDFLSLGSVIGFFHLEQLVYDPDRTLGYLFDYDEFLRDSYFGEPPPPEDLDHLAAQRTLLQKLSDEFELSPWIEPRRRLDALQDRWRRRFENSAEDGTPEV